MYQRLESREIMVLDENVPNLQIFWRLQSIPRKNCYKVALDLLTFPYSFAVVRLGTRYWAKQIFGLIRFYCSYILTQSRLAR